MKQQLKTNVMKSSVVKNKVKTNGMKREDVLLVLSYSNCDVNELWHQLNELNEEIGYEKGKQNYDSEDRIKELETERWIVETILNEKSK